MSKKGLRLSSERFLKLLNELHLRGFVLSDRDFAKKIGVNAQSIYDIRSGKNAVTYKYLTLLQVAFPQVNTSFLKGEQDYPMLFEEKTEANEANQNYSNVRFDEQVGKKIRVPVIPLNATATFVETVDGGYQINELDFDYDVVEKLPGRKYNALTVIFVVQGDSMYPLYRQNTKVLCTWVDESNWHLVRGVCVLSTKSGMLLLKRVTNNKNGLMVLKSDNLNYGEITLRLDDIQAVWKVEYQTFAPAE